MRSSLLMLSLGGLFTVAAVATAPSESDLALVIAERTLLTESHGSMKDVIDRNRRFLVREPSRNPKLFPASANTDDGLALDDDLLQSLEGVESSENMECDAAFFECVVIKECASCFDQMQMNSVDWAGVTQKTECDTVVTTLQKNNLCKSLGPNNKDKFCDTFKSCVEFDDKESKGKEDTLDCSALTKCDWPGIHSSFIGDGVCQDAYFNTCYNTAICGFDKGDCCKDTCKEPRHGYTECGSDGYACRDPLSKNCDPTLTLSCPSSSYENTDDSHRPLPVCTSDQSLYRIDMFDTFGDGWGETAITITASSGASKGQALTPIYQGGLKNGAEGNDYFCLSLNPSCYHVNMSGGVWGRESSWYIQGYAKGSPPVASGGGSMSCEFGVAGGSCNNTCTGASNHAPGQNPQYRDFKNMVNCIEEKCMLQVSACNSDQACANCYAEEIPDYCFSIDSFLAVTDCSMCKCSGVNASYFCDDKQAPGVILPDPSSKKGGKESTPIPCTPAQTLAGGKALLDFSKCMDNFEQSPLMLTDFDSNHFGPLDDFEACAHAYNDKADHGGKTALGCMQILYDAMHPENTKDDIPTKVIQQLSTLLYNKGQLFCDCANQASKDCPLCPSFFNFKTLTYEAIDACASLDNIDCAAWEEYWAPCKANLNNAFGAPDLSNPEQCSFIYNKCGEGKPFPSFRRLDCAPGPSWDFYLDYSEKCLKQTVPSPMAPVKPKVATKMPTPYDAVNPNNIKPQPPTSTTPTGGDNVRPSYKSPDDKKKKSHWLRNLIIIGIVGGIAYYIYKKQSDGFSFVRYRRMTNFGAGVGGMGGGAYAMNDNDMFSGLSLESSTNFEPPSLPPPPMSMPNNGGYGM